MPAELSTDEVPENGSSVHSADDPPATACPLVGLKNSSGSMFLSYHQNCGAVSRVN